MADALHRIRKTLNRTPHLMADQGKFMIYLVVLLLHSVVYSICLYLIQRGFEHRSEKMLKIQIYARIVLFTSMWAFQSILMVMFWWLTRPAFRQIKIAPKTNNFFS